MDGGSWHFCVRPICGFAILNGVGALTTLFVTQNNFLRPHLALDYRVPVPLREIQLPHHAAGQVGQDPRSGLGSLTGD
jgi:hypothetical protein